MTISPNTDTMLEKVDILRKRFSISYREAYDLLERHGNNVIQACIELEDRGKQPDLLQQAGQRMEVMGQDLMSKVQEIIKTGQTSRIRILRDGKQVLTIPTAVGAVGAMIFPMATVVAAAAAVAARYELILEMKHERNTGEARADKHHPGITNVHEEAKTEYCEITPSVSAGKVGSV
ncbi:MAG TPA: DUF4342 domain-containing protein [Bacilli bacterium]|nr:DUF4342 domain-containing protein [Bacilli bacterium]